MCVLLLEGMESWKGSIFFHWEVVDAYWGATCRV